jgi:hypothetical protein
MRLICHMLFLAALALAAGCTMQHGSLDFPNPWFDAHCGPVAVIAFRSSTVFRVGSTYFTLALPFYAPIILAVVLFTTLWFLIRRRARA